MEWLVFADGSVDDDLRRPIILLETRGWHIATLVQSNRL